MPNVTALFKLCIALFLVEPAVVTAFAQTQPPPATRQGRRMQRAFDAAPGAWTPEQLATMTRLRDAAMQDDYALSQLRHLTDNIGPRLTGSPQAQQAVEYVAQEMRKLGAEVQLEKTTVPHWVRGAETADLVSWPGQPPGTTQKILLTALGGSVATPADGLEKEVVVVDSFDALKLLPKGAAEGKILLFNERFNKDLAAQGRGLEAYGQAVAYRGAGPRMAGAAGAVAVLVRSVGNADYRLPHTGSTSYAEGVKPIPAAAVTAEDADLLANLSHQGPVRMKLTLTPKTLPRGESFNVIADWKGSEHPEQVVIVSGHLDSWDLATGAIDDGAGITASMETIRLLQHLNLHPRRTIRFIAWMNEEHGGDGAKAYATDHATEIANHIGAIESDLGAGHPRGIEYAGKAELAAWLRPISQVLEPIGATTLEPTTDAGSDIGKITEAGVPGFAPAQDDRFYFNYHHTAADTFDKVVPKELNENAAVIAVLAYGLADSTAAAPR